MSQKLTRDEIFTKVRKDIADVVGCPLDEIAYSTIITPEGSPLHIDSLDAVEIIMAVEDSFDLEISDAQADAFSTVASIVDHVESRQR